MKIHDGGGVLIPLPLLCVIGVDAAGELLPGSSIALDARWLSVLDGSVYRTHLLFWTKAVSVILY